MKSPLTNKPTITITVTSKPTITIRITNSNYHVLRTPKKIKNKQTTTPSNDNNDDKNDNM